MSKDRDVQRIHWPLLTLRDSTVLPGATVILSLDDPRSRAAVERARSGRGGVVLVAQKDPGKRDPDPADLYHIGTLAFLRDRNPGRGRRVRLVAEHRVRVRRYKLQPPCYQVFAEVIPENESATPAVRSLMKRMLMIYARYAELGGRVRPGAVVRLAVETNPGRVADLVAADLLRDPRERQAFLEITSPKARLQRAFRLLTREISVLEVEQKIQHRVHRQLEDEQREYVLREKLRAIQKELGEDAEPASEAERFREIFAALDLPSEVRQKVDLEIQRFAKMAPMSQECVVTRSYLDWMANLPWNEESSDGSDLQEVERVLNRDHYGLHRVKERILEYLAVGRLVQDGNAPILCFIGPPGVGKTSLARSIAQAIGRRFVHVSLGGVGDAAEIRGHRRTYIGAMPGRIIQGMRRAGTRNPVFLLDEIDKLTIDSRGDPSAALLEALDPEQNWGFSDHFLEVPFDLSRVFFIVTANREDTIPRPLRDRLEIIRLPSYTDEEKLAIALRHLLPKQRTAHGLTAAQLKVSRGALETIVTRYTREAGVRDLERHIARIARKTARSIVEGRDHPIRVTRRNLHRYLSQPPHPHWTMDLGHQVGLAVAVAWNGVGGQILPVEVVILEGGGELRLTGHMGRTMREAAQTAWTFIRSRPGKLGLSPTRFQTLHAHVHIPDGAAPKDGPSASLAMAVALASALTRRPVRGGVAMTGEISLNGWVLPVGGLPEKILAAWRGGIRHLIVPKGNEGDLRNLPSDLRKRMRFSQVRHADEVLERLLISGPESSAHMSSKSGGRAVSLGCGSLDTPMGSR